MHDCLAFVLATLLFIEGAGLRWNQQALSLLAERRLAVPAFAQGCWRMRPPEAHEVTMNSLEVSVSLAGPVVVLGDVGPS